MIVMQVMQDADLMSLLACQYSSNILLHSFSVCLTAASGGAPGDDRFAATKRIAKKRGDFKKRQKRATYIKGKDRKPKNSK